MSLFGALFTGVSALDAQSNAMAMISNNIANVNTVGYKEVTAGFSSLVTSSGNSGQFASGGVDALTDNTIDQQGVLEQTSSSTDLAISGAGFFVVRPEPNSSSPVLYTRAGSFTEDSSGYLRNTAGQVLYGWPLDANGNIPSANSNINSLQPVNVSFLGGQTKPTTTATMSLNLNAGDTTVNATPNNSTAPNFTRQVTVFDSLGAAQTMTLNFYKTGTNTWSMGVTDAATPPDQLLPVSTPAVVGPPAVPAANMVPVTFNTDGSIADVNGVAATTPLAVAGAAGTGISWGNGSSATQTISLDLSGLTQYDSAYNVTSINQNGAALGLNTGVSIDNNGVVSATFSNGTTAAVYQLPLATFSNPNGLSAANGDSYSAGSDSGDYNLVQANSAGAGSINADSLETSNVDLGTEFSKMIVTQNAYSAGTKVITTADQMLQDLLQVVQ